MSASHVPDLLARPLPLALKMAAEAGWSVEVKRAEPFFRRKELVWSADHAYVLKQIAGPDHKLLLIVGCQFERGCTANGTQD
jgi:hypothetical protein